MSHARPTLLVLASTFPRWKGDTEPRFVESLSFELARNFDVVVLAPHCRGAEAHELFRRGQRSLEVHRFRYCFTALENLAYDGGMLARLRENPLRFLLLPLFFLAQLSATARLCRERGIAAMHAHWIIPQGLVAAILRVLSSRTPPILITSHGGDLYALRGVLLERLKRWIVDKADAVTVVSSAMRDYCEARRLAPGRVVVQSMGVDLDEAFTPGDGNVPRDGLVFVGRLVEKKGVEHLVRAVALLSGSHPDLALTIVGDGPLRGPLEVLARELGADARIRFVGSVRNEEVPEYLRAAKISVMPSVVAASGDQEGLGLVAVEALGCGCAVVAFDLPAVRDTILHGKTGLMADPENASDLADKIAMLLDDETLRQRLAESGRRHALEKFTWSAVGANYTKIITEMIANAHTVHR